LYGLNPAYGFANSQCGRHLLAVVALSQELNDFASLQKDNAAPGSLIDSAFR